MNGHWLSSVEQTATPGKEVNPDLARPRFGLCFLTQPLLQPHSSQGRGTEALLTGVLGERLPIRLVEPQRQPLLQLSADGYLHRRRLLREVGEVVSVPELRFLFDICEGRDATVRFDRVASIYGRFRSAHGNEPPF